MVGRRHALTSFQATIHTVSECVKCLGLSRTREAIYGASFVRIKLKTSSEACLDSSRCMCPGDRMSSSRLWRAIRPVFPSLSPDRLRFADLLVEFLHNYLCPSPDIVSFGLEDVLFTAATDSEDFEPAGYTLPPSGQKVQTTLRSWTCWRMLLRSLTEWLKPKTKNKPCFLSAFDLALTLPASAGLLSSAADSALCLYFRHFFNAGMCTGSGSGCSCDCL